MSANLVKPLTGNYSRSEQIGWYFYDWANSAFSSTVITTFLGPFLTALATTASQSTGGYVYPLGIAVRAGSFYPYMVSLSVVLQVLFLPILGAVADYTNLKKQFLGLFAYIGAFATICFLFVSGDRYWLGGLLFLVANLSFGASIVFYNAFLPELAAPDDRDRISSQGWALGYLGGGVLLLFNLIFVQFMAEGMGIDRLRAAQICIVSAGVWWAIFTLIPMSRLQRRSAVNQLPAGSSYLTIGFRQLGHTLREMPKFPQTLLFLIAYLLYNDGIQTVIALSADFGAQELKLDTGVLVQVILMVQFVAFIGALAFNYIANAIGTKRAIMASLVVWVGVTVFAWRFLETQFQFFAMGAVIALVLGGSQALSRSLFSLMIPKGRESEYFSLYEVSERGTSWMGPLIFGLALQFTGSYRIAILSVAIFFTAGLILLPFVNIRKAITEAGNEVPHRV